MAILPVLPTSLANSLLGTHHISIHGLLPFGQRNGSQASGRQKSAHPGKILSIELKRGGARVCGTGTARDRLLPVLRQCRHRNGIPNEHLLCQLVINNAN